jgi:hypothetical protein
LACPALCLGASPLMDKLLSRNRLIFVLVALVVTKLAILPLFDWQLSKLSEIRGKKVQLSKSIDLIDSQADYHQRVFQLHAEKGALAPLFYKDNDDTKLSIQKDIEEVFSNNKLPIERLSWVLDERTDTGIRRLRVLVAFNGQLESVITSLLKMSNHPKIARQVEWRQGLTYNTNVGLGQSRGHVTLDFFASDTFRGTMTSKEKMVANIEDGL